MSSNIDNRNSSVRDIAKLFPEEKRLGTKASDLVSGIALTVCLDIDEAFEVLGTPAEQRVAILKFTSRGRPGAAVFAPRRLPLGPAHARAANDHAGAADTPGAPVAGGL